MKTIPFLKESIKNLKTVGTVTKSSPFLCRGMVKHVDYSRAKFIVELGAGDGVITHYILKKMAPDAKLMIFEVNESFTQQLDEIDDDRLIVIQDGAEKLEEYLEQYEFGELDAVISAIPFVIFTEEQARSIVETCKNNMKVDAPYIQVHYSLIKRKMYRDIFGNVNTSFIPLNIPPAFVMVCENRIPVAAEKTIA